MWQNVFHPMECIDGYKPDDYLPAVIYLLVQISNSTVASYNIQNWSLIFRA